MGPWCLDPSSGREAGSARWSWVVLLDDPLGWSRRALGKALPPPHPLPHTPASAGVTLAQDGVPQRPQGGRSTPCPRASGASASELTRGGTRKREPWVGNTEPWPSELPEAASASHEVTACTRSCGDAQCAACGSMCISSSTAYAG